MFPRVATTTTKDGKKYNYLKIVRSYRDKKGKSRQKIVANLGQVEKLGDELDKLVEKLRGYCKKNFFLPEEIRTESTPIWGPCLIARSLWEEIGMPEILSSFLKKHKVDFNLEEKIFLLVANRLHDPKSEHGMARWLEKMYACYQDKRVLPDWLPEDKITEDKRVKVAWGQLKEWYRAGDILFSHKKEIEKEIYLKLRDLFSINVDLVFYDLTSTYFALREPKGGLKRHGHSRDEKKRNVQVVVGIVMVDGLPIASHVFKGNTADKATLRQVVDDIANRFGIRQVIFIADRGTVSEENIEFLESLNCRYLLGHPRRRSRRTREYFEKLTNNWQRIDDNTKFQETLTDDGRRVFVVKSRERKEYEEAMRKKCMQKCEQALERIKLQVASGRLKKTSKIAARVEKIMQRTKGYRYFRYHVPQDGKFEYFVDEEKLAKEEQIEGTYILLTNDPKIPAYDAICAYKNLSEVENFFRELKDNLGIRPNYHRTDKRIKAHIFISHLALLLLCILKRTLKKKNINLSPSDAIEATETIGIAELNINGEAHRIVSRGGRDARKVVSALKIKDLNP
jgi:transposase